MELQFNITAENGLVATTQSVVTALSPPAGTVTTTLAPTMAYNNVGLVSLFSLTNTELVTTPTSATSTTTSHLEETFRSIGNGLSDSVRTSTPSATNAHPQQTSSSSGNGLSHDGANGLAVALGIVTAGIVVGVGIAVRVYKRIKSNNKLHPRHVVFEMMSNEAGKEIQGGNTASGTLHELGGDTAGRYEK